MEFVQGRVFEMFLMIFLIVSIYYFMEQVKKGKQVYLREIAGIEAIDEAVGRAAEMGRPIHYTPGYTLGGLYNPTMGPGVMAGLVILKSVAEKAAARGVNIIVTLAQPEAVPLAEATVTQSYALHKMLPPQNAVRFISTEQYAYAAGVIGIIKEEMPAANILMGYFWSESLQFAEAGSYIGAMQIGGTSAASQLPFFVVSCDYTLIGEELFAAKAYIDKDPAGLGSIIAQDWIRAIMIALTVSIWISGNLHLDWLIKIFST